jgi:hypothetical protein
MKQAFWSMLIVFILALSFWGGQLSCGCGDDDDNDNDDQYCQELKNMDCTVAAFDISTNCLLNCTIASIGMPLCYNSYCLNTCEYGYYDKLAQCGKAFHCGDNSSGCEKKCYQAALACYEPLEECNWKQLQTCDTETSDCIFDCALQNTD